MCINQNYTYFMLVCCRILLISLCVQWDANHHSRLLWPKVFHQHSLDFDLNIHLTINHDFSIRCSSSVFVLNYCIFLIRLFTYLSIDFPFNAQTISLLPPQKRWSVTSEVKKRHSERKSEYAWSWPTGMNSGGGGQERYPFLWTNSLSILGWECKCLCSAVLNR